MQYRPKGVCSQLIQFDIEDNNVRNVVFTGGCGNLGSVMVKVLLEYGASVAVLARADRLDESYAPYRNSNKLVVIQTDLSRTDSTKSSFAK